MKSIKYKKLIRNFLLLFLLMSINLISQSNFGPSQTDYRRDIIKSGTSPAYSNGLAAMNTVFFIGKASSSLYKRAVYQWDLTDLEIPDGSEINSVHLSFTCFKNGHTFELSANFYNITYDMISGNYIEEIYQQMDNNDYIIAEQITAENNQMNFISINPNNLFNLAIKNSLPNNKFVLGIKLFNDHSPLFDYRIWDVANPDITLQITFTPPQKIVTVDQKDSYGSSFGQVGWWNDEIIDFTNYDVPHPFTFPLSSTQTLKGDQSIHSNEKYNNWVNEAEVINHHSFTIYSTTNQLTSQFEPTYSSSVIKNNLEATGLENGSIEFKDPWLIDYPDPLFNNNERNQGMNAPFKPRTSPFYPNYTTSYSGDVYKGVFLDQDYNVPGNPYYSVNSPDMQPISVNGQTHKFFLQNWSGTGATFQSTGSAQTGVVFTSGSAVVTANLKGQLISNEGSGFSNNGQRKIVRDNAGFYHSVYTSQGLVWYTKSTTTSFTGDWDKDEILFTNNTAKNPSMGIAGNIFSIVTELQDGSVASIFLNDNGSYTEVAQIDNNYYGSSYPVVSRTDHEVFIIYKPSSTSPLKYRRYYLSNDPPYNWVWTDEADLPNSTSNSKFPSIVGDKTLDDIHITWQEGTTQIKYLFSHKPGNNRTFSLFTTVSTGSGYSFNTNPSISLNSDGPFVSWTGSRKENIQNKIIGKENWVYVYKAILRTKSSSSWGDFNVIGSEVNYTNNNSTLNNNGETVIAYSQSGGQSSKWIKRAGGYYSEIVSLSHTGLQINLSNGSSLSNLKAMVFNTAALPYPINRSTTDFTTTIPKVTESEEVSYGRTGIISKQDVEFVFTVEDILLDDNNIEFTSRVDTLPVLSLEELNSAARSNTFNLDENSSLLFSLYYLVINPELASTVLGENDYVRFKLELVKTVGDQVVGIFDDITFTKENAYDHENTSYKVDCTGIESGSYYFRITADENCQTGLSIANTQNDAGNLAKKNYTEVYFNGETSPLTYDLSQNYPNPFNPSTTIKYQIPNAGNVTLKVYDILGREVTTLVDEFKNEGRYEVNFNASKLASGVYIYSIKSNDFTASKKLMLLK